MNRLLTLVCLSVVLTTASAYAEDSSNGCGVGWQVVQKQSLLATAIRDTTNFVLPNTFSMTSGTSGCAKHSIVKKDMPAFEYVYVNFDTLKIEMAQGRGENLAALARTMGCTDASVQRFSDLARSHYSTIVGSGDLSPADLFDNVKTQVEGDSLLKISCNS